MSASTSNPLTVEMTNSFGDVEEGGKSKDSEDAKSLAQSQAEVRIIGGHNYGCVWGYIAAALIRKVPALCNSQKLEFLLQHVN